MKKTITLILAFVLGLSLCACGHTHEFGQWSTVSEASCTAEGSRERVCECGEKETEAIPASGHSYGSETEISAVTCTEDGKTEKTCSVCGDVQTQTVAATGHSFQAATMFTPKTCNTCGTTEGEALATVIQIGDVIEAEEHSFTLERVDFTSKLSEKRGYTTYMHNSNGNYVLAIRLDFTNLATEAFERWHSNRVENVAMEYMGKYKYVGEYWSPVGDIVPLASDVVYIVYEVPESMSKDSSNSILASFTIDGQTYAVRVQDGTGIDASEDAPAAVDVSGNISIGDEVSNNSTFSFAVEDLYYTAKPSYKEGNSTYIYSNDGYYLICKLNFTNLSAEALDSWNSGRVTKMKLTYADKYHYDGVSWIPGREIVPLDNGYLFVMFAVSEAVEDGTESLVFSFNIDGCDFTFQVR